MIPITPGNALDNAEAAHVEDTLVRLIQNGGGTMSMPSSQFIVHQLKWPTRRYADVRDHLERGQTRERISARVGQPINIFMSRSTLSVQAGKPERNDEILLILASHLATTFQRASQNLDSSDLRAWVTEQLEAFLRQK